jgi:hypothetical protein
MGNRFGSALPERPRKSGRIGTAVTIALIAGSVSALTPAAAVAATGTASATPAQAVHGVTGNRPVETPDAAALATAEATGRAVTVAADETDESTIQANPNGSFTYTATVQPTRVKKNGTWVAIDTTLQRNEDGTLTPIASPSGVAFSAGGRTPLATLTGPGGQKLAVSWPGSLPSPTVSGATATYRNVLPGVNLELTDTQYGGYTEQLVITSAKAAANPALSDIHFRTSTSGLTLSRTGAGGIQATDSSGAVRFTSPTATMWSSAPAAATAGARKAADAVAQADTAPAAEVGVRISPGGLDLLPPTSALTGKNVSYPVVIDPTVSPKYTNNWTWVSQTDSGTSYWQGGNNTHDTNAHVGDDDWTDPSFGVTRSLFSLDMSGLAGTNVTAASFSVEEQGPTSSWSGNRQLDLHGAAGFNSSTNWNNQPAAWSPYTAGQFPSLDTDGTGSGDFDVTTLVQNAVAAGYNSQTMVVEADNESDDTAYRYLIGGGSAGPKLSVTYYSTPNLPADLAVTNGTKSTACATSAPGTWIGASDSHSVTLTADVSSADSDTAVSSSFWSRETEPTMPAHWTDMSGPTITTGAANQKTEIRSSALSLTDGEEFQWQAYSAEDGGAFSTTAAPGTSTDCWFRADFTPPTITGTPTAVPPTSTAPGHNTGTLSVSATDGGTNPSGVARILYNVNGTSLTGGGDGEKSVATSGTATVPLTAENWGTNVVWYAAQDAAGNISTPTYYSYYVAPGPYTPGTAGDLDGDGIPDLAAVDSSGDIDIYSNPLSFTTTGADASGQLLPASAAGDTTGAATFTGALLAHSGSVHGQNCDDLDLVQNGNLVIEENNNCNLDSPNSSWTPIFGQRPSAPVTGTPAAAAAAYDSGNWSQAQQLVALSSPQTVNGSTVLVTTDLVTLELSGGTEYLWEFPMAGATPTAPVLLASGSAWSGVTLVNAGLVKGSHALWTRNNSTGALTQYLGVDTDTSGTLTGTTIAASGYSASTYPLITAEGDAGDTGTTAGPALWAVDATGTLQLIPSTLNSAGAPTLQPASTPMTASGWANGLTDLN